MLDRINNLDSGRAISNHLTERKREEEKKWEEIIGAGSKKDRKIYGEKDG